MKEKESEIQSRIIDYLQILENQGKLMFHRANNIPVSQIRNGKRIFRAMPKGSKKGLCDIFCVINGYFIGLEIKTSTGRQSEHQKAFQKLVENNKGQYHIVKSVDDVKRVLEKII